MPPRLRRLSRQLTHFSALSLLLLCEAGKFFPHLAQKKLIGLTVIQLQESRWLTDSHQSLT